MKNTLFVDFEKLNNNSIELIRLEFFKHLVKGFVDNTVLLEIFNGVNSVDQIMEINLLQNYSCINQGDINKLDHTQPKVSGDSKYRSSPYDNTYDHIIWFNGLNWTRPNEKSYLEWCYNKLKIGGKLHISFAGKSSFIYDRNVELELANEIRNNLGYNTLIKDFESMRFSDQEVIELFKNYYVSRHEKIDINLVLDTFKSFSEWHLGSVKCLFGDLDCAVQPKLKEEFITKLFKLYLNKKYSPRLTTCILSIHKAR